MEPKPVYHTNEIVDPDAVAAPYPSVNIAWPGKLTAFDGDDEYGLTDRFERLEEALKSLSKRLARVEHFLWHGEWLEDDD